MQKVLTICFVLAIMFDVNFLKGRYEMKIFKKLILFTMIAAMVFSFAACGDNNTAEPTVKPTDPSADEAGFTTVTEGKLTMATNAQFPPYEYYEGSEIVGIDAEVAALIAQKLGLELVIEDTEFDSIIPGVQSNKYDMGMAGMTVDPDRLKSVNFSDSYATGIQVVIVPEGSSIQSVDDLTGKKIGVQQGTTGYIYASDDYGEENVVSYASGALAVEGIKSGKVDCVIIDNEPAKAYVAENEGLKILETQYAVEDYAICFSKDNEALQEAVNKALGELIADGSVQKIVDKYITE